MATYYISTTGSDGAAGTIGAPWASFTKFTSICNPGDLLYVRGGTYYQSLNIGRSGNASNTIKIYAYPGETVILDGQYVRPNTQYLGLIHISGSYIEIDGINSYNSLNRGFTVYGSYALVKNLTVQLSKENGLHCEVPGTNCTFDNVSVWSCYMLNANEATAPVWGGGIAVAGFNGTRNHDVIFKNCRSWQNWGEGLSTIACYNVTFQDCKVWDNYSVNFYLNTVENILIQRNIAYNDGNARLRTYQGVAWNYSMNDETYLSNYPASQNITFINNLSYNGFCSFFTWARTTTILNSLIAHNTFITGGTGFGSVGSGTTITNNITNVSVAGGDPSTPEYYVPNSPTTSARLTTVLTDWYQNNRNNPTTNGAIEVGAAPPDTSNLALNKTAIASSIESASYPASNVVDGVGSTRWSSQFSDPQWIYIDLISTYNLTSVVLVWEAAYATNYQIQVSNDAVNWNTIYTKTGGTGGTETLTLSGYGRYVRMYGTTRATVYGYSLYEFKIYGTLVQVNVTNPGNQNDTIGTNKYLQIYATDSAGGIITYTANNLPLGLSIANNTGLITGTANTLGISNTFINATSNTGSANNTTFQWTISDVTWGNVPTGWLTSDIGTTGIVGNVGYLNNIYRIRGAGTLFGANNTIDNIRYLYKQIPTDFSFSFRIAAFDYPSANARFGSIIRSSLNNNSPTYSIVLSTDGLLHILYRANSGGQLIDSSVSTTNRWVKTTKLNNILYIYTSPSGNANTWIERSNNNINSWGSNIVYLGIGINSGTTTSIANGTFDNISLTTSLPSPWLSTDIGSVAANGTAYYLDGSFNIDGSGLNIWGQSDSFYYVYQPVANNFAFSYRVVSLQQTNLYAKYGSDIRVSLNANSEHICLNKTPLGENHILIRSTANQNTSLIYTATTGQDWHKIQRYNNTINSYSSSTGTSNSWVLLNSNTAINWPNTIYVGLEVCSLVTTLGEGVFDNVVLETFTNLPPIVLTTKSNVLFLGNFL